MSTLGVWDDSTMAKTHEQTPKSGSTSIAQFIVEAAGCIKLRQLFGNDISDILSVFSDPINDPRLAAVEPWEANEVQAALC